MTDETPWLTREQLRAWMKLVAVMELLPAALDQQLQRDADLTHFDYMVVAMLSETEGRFAALTYPRDEDDPALCEARLTGADAAVAGAPGAAPSGVLFRDVTADDGALLRHATLAAMNWRAATFVDADLDRPEFAHYFAGYDPVRDHGVVAVDGEGPVGVAWVRFLPADDPGYGFVAEDVPELTTAVEPRGRGRGVGTALLTRLLAAGCAAGWPGVSLSVEDGNTGARILYERVGFRTVGRNGDSDTMLARC